MNSENLNAEHETEINEAFKHDKLDTDELYIERESDFSGEEQRLSISKAPQVKFGQDIDPSLTESSTKSSYRGTEKVVQKSRSESSLAICSTPRNQFSGKLFQDEITKSLPPWFFRTALFCTKKRRKSDIGLMVAADRSSHIRGTNIYFTKNFKIFVMCIIFFVLFQTIS